MKTNLYFNHNEPIERHNAINPRADTTTNEDQHHESLPLDTVSESRTVRASLSSTYLDLIEHRKVAEPSASPSRNSIYIGVYNCL